MIPAIFMGLLVAVASTGAAVWLHNRYLAPFVEFPPKKFVALLALPSGLPLGILGGWRLSNLPILSFERLLWSLVALAGAVVVVRLILAAVEQWSLQRDSHFKSVRGMPGALNWSVFPIWQRALLLLVSPFNQVGALRVHAREVTVPGLPKPFEGYRILHVTDPHIHPTLRSEWFQRAMEAAMDLSPDIVLHGGDFVTDPENLSKAEEVLRSLAQAPDGVLTVRGNHDLWKAPRRAARVARGAGMRLLSNEGVILRREQAAISIVGLEVPYVGLGPKGERDLQRLPRPRVALVHTPDAFATAERLGCSLALAGHTHGGQVRIPILGATVTSSGAGPRLATGIGRLGMMQCITSNGLGSFFPLRILCPPEIGLIILRSGDSA
jgi:predicted MPP superfamily phosphohydrolase